MVQPNEAERLFMELRIIFMITSTFAARQTLPLFRLKEALVHDWTPVRVEGPAARSSCWRLPGDRWPAAVKNTEE